QAEDGIRDYKVTGVQTCALPISKFAPVAERQSWFHPGARPDDGAWTAGNDISRCKSAERLCRALARPAQSCSWSGICGGHIRFRSEERRVGKEGRSGVWGERWQR